MNTPELTILHSETIAVQLAFERLALTPSEEDLMALSDRLGMKTPQTFRGRGLTGGFWAFRRRLSLV